MELLPTRAHSPTAWGKFRHPVSMNMPLFALSFEWKDKVLNSSMAQSIMEVYEVVCRLDHTCRCTESPNDNMQKTATTLLRVGIQKESFFKPVASCVSRVLGPVSRYLRAETPSQICDASWGSRPRQWSQYGTTVSRCWRGTKTWSLLYG